MALIKQPLGGQTLLHLLIGKIERTDTVGLHRKYVYLIRAVTGVDRDLSVDGNLHSRLGHKRHTHSVRAEHYRLYLPIGVFQSEIKVTGRVSCKVRYLRAYRNRAQGAIVLKDIFDISV